MSDPVRVLTSIGQALSAMRFYDPGHPARERALEASYQEVLDLMAQDSTPRFTFVEGETLYHRLLLRELGDWDWAVKFENAGIQRIEFLPGATLEDYHRFLHDVVARLSGNGAWNAVERQFAPTSIRYGAIGFRDAGADGIVSIELQGKGMSLSLDHEVKAIEWIHDEVKEQRELPLLEAEVVVRSLALAIHQESQVVLPLLQLKQFDQYTTTHSCNVAVLASALAEFLGCEPAHARALGVCGLLHDIGKVWIPRDVLVKPGMLTAEERAIIERHPVEGARILIERERNLDLAAVVSYEHHRWVDGNGYPAGRYDRPSHHASRLVQVCDVFDALCTDRPYRPGLRPEAALAQLEAEAGSHFDPQLVAAFAAMIRNSMLKFVPLATNDGSDGEAWRVEGTARSADSPASPDASAATGETTEPLTVDPR